MVKVRGCSFDGLITDLFVFYLDVNVEEIATCVVERYRLVLRFTVLNHLKGLRSRR